MEIVFADSGGTWDCSLSGEMDMYESPKFMERYEALFPAGSAGAMVVNLSALTYIDSSGIGFLFRVFSDARSRGIGYCLYGARGMVASLLTLSKMSSIIPLEKTRECALERARRR
jgi:anti-sigma B factor antagonist